MADALLADLRPPFAVGERSRKSLRPAVLAALRDGWPQAELAAHLTRNPYNVKIPAALLAARLRDLPDAPATLPMDDPRDPWCGMCDERTRLVEDDDDGRPHSCPDCHPDRARRAS